MKINLGEKIRTLRKAAGMTQEQLAEALCVTTGAVYKWESGRALPELEMLVDIAEFFETSVDALLDYGWESGSMGHAAEKLRSFAREKKLDEGMRYAEKVLQKYPNSFEVVWESADVYFLTMTGDAPYAQRAVELYQRAIQLFDQNENDQISLITIQNRIASCYCFMDRMDDAIELLKKNNVEGLNDSLIGLLMSQDESKAKESLKYLSDALYGGHAMIFQTCIGYANAYTALGEYEKIEALMLWLMEMGKGLRDVNSIGYQDKADVRLCTILAAMAARRGNTQGAYDWLRKAKETALRFDAAPQYRAAVGLKFYHGNDRATAYDDMGKTAMDTIENFMADEDAGEGLHAIWEKIKAESPPALEQ